MVISSNINNYVQNSLIRGKLCKWHKPFVSVYISSITAQINNKDFWYFQVKNAIAAWNNILANNNINIQFQIISTAPQADIIIHWVKVGRVFEGMCKYLSVTNNIINKVSIDIGLPNEFSGKNITELSIYCAIMHEFGHALGLGHGVEIDDIMFVPHQKNISAPSDNDLYVLKQIYNVW